LQEELMVILLCVMSDLILFHLQEFANEETKEKLQ